MNKREVIFKEKSDNIVGIIVLLVLTISLLLVIFLYKCETYYELVGLVKEGEKESYVQLVVENNKLDLIGSTSFYVEDELYEYSEYEKNFVYENGKLYAVLNCKLNKKIDKNIVMVKYKLKDMSIYQKIKKGLI